jgi:hypothetical protein
MGGEGLKIEILDFHDLNHDVNKQMTALFNASPYTHPFQTPEMIRVLLDDDCLSNYKSFIMTAYKDDELIAVCFLAFTKLKS